MVRNVTLDSTLDEISNRTLAHYEDSAEQFWLGTRDHDVSQNLAALLTAIEGDPPYRILDFGCGPGRDLRRLKNLGHLPTGLDGAVSFVRMAREYADVPVLQQDFLRLDLPAGQFDGVFANASLFHVPTRELPRVLRELRQCLRTRGVLFASNPRGDNHEGWQRGRFGAYHDFEAWSEFLGEAGFEEILHYYRPEGLPREQQPWLASAWRRVEDTSVHRRPSHRTADVSLKGRFIYSLGRLKSPGELPLRGLSDVRHPSSSAYPLCDEFVSTVVP